MSQEGPANGFGTACPTFIMQDVVGEGEAVLQRLQLLLHIHQVQEAPASCKGPLQDLHTRRASLRTNSMSATQHPAAASTALQVARAPQIHDRAAY